MNMFDWQSVNTYTSCSYTCGYCGNPLASEKGYRALHPASNNTTTGYIYICHHCEKPTFFDLITDTQTPGKRFGNDVGGIDDQGVASLYAEARDCFSRNAFTAAVLSCRKLLMHIAVAKGDSAGKNFIEYVEYLSARGYVPPDAKTWVDCIRTKSNEANHEIVIMSEEEAKDLILFVEMLLKLVYEFPASSKKYAAA